MNNDPIDAISDSASKPEKNKEQGQGDDGDNETCTKDVCNNDSKICNISNKYLVVPPEWSTSLICTCSS